MCRPVVLLSDEGAGVGGSRVYHAVEVCSTALS